MGTSSSQAFRGRDIDFFTESLQETLNQNSNFLLGESPPPSAANESANDDRPTLADVCDASHNARLR